MLLLTLRGTPTLYYGDELGLTDVTIPAALVQDPRELHEPGLGLGRDPVRSPMPWDGSPGAGFSTVAPWLPLNSDWPVRNVGCQIEDASSILTLHRRLLAARRTHSALSAGGFRLLDAGGNVLAYERWHGPERLIVGLNLGASAQHLVLPEWARAFRPLLSTVDNSVSIGSGALSLRADEGVILTAG